MSFTTFTTLADAVSMASAIHPARSFIFQNDKGIETHYTFGDMDAATDRRAAYFQSLGMEKGERVGLIIIEPEDFVLTFFALVRIGVLPVPLYPPLSLNALDAYMDRTSRILASAEARALVVSPKLNNLLFALRDSTPAPIRILRADELEKPAPLPVYPFIRPEDLAFLQYTSGSTSEPKGVMVTHANLIANVKGSMDVMQLEPGKDVAVSWLPLYHDMGLIGFVITGIVWGLDVVFIPTVRFLLKPSVWMDAMHRHKGTATFAPNFAYALMTRRVKPDELESWDLSHVKLMGCGAEPIHPDTMRDFENVYHTKCGLPREAIMPAYGMAEATLAISLVPLASRWSARSLHAESFEQEGIAREPVEGEPFISHVSCGFPQKGSEVTIFHPETRDRMPEGHQGEIAVRGPSITTGYYKNPKATAASYHAGWLFTGDLGYVFKGEIYVTGRIKDLIILNGRNIHPQSIEWIVNEVDGVRRGNVVAFSRPGKASEELVVALEVKALDPTGLVDRIKAVVQEQLQVAISEVILLDPGMLPKTSSGKLQRAKTRQLYLQGKLGKTGSRIPGATANKLTLARHAARSAWSRAKSAVLGG